MPTEPEVDAAENVINDCMAARSLPPTWGYREVARKALEAAERARDIVRRANCQHLNRRYSGSIGSDGSMSWDWYCPECGKSDSGSSPARDRPSQQILSQ